MALPLSLRPSVRSGDKSESLSSVIEQIFAERGHLRDITEETLEAEIKAEDEDDESLGSSDAEQEQPQDIETRAKDVQAARQEMLQLVGQANNDAMTALDFVSLLLSKDAPRQAEASMSPALKTMTPAGTLGYDKTNAPKPTQADAEMDRKIALGLNLDSLNSTANKLLGSATRLVSEIERETKYWEQILSVSEKGWNLCRMPGQTHTVGVRFGFSEAPPQFQARSLAALRSDESGDLFLDREPSAEAKSIRVRICDGDNVVETSTTPLLASPWSSGLDVLVHQARDSLFDEELFFELTRNARSLFSNGVRVNNGVILVPFDTSAGPSDPLLAVPRRSLAIDLVPRTRTPSEGGITADCIALTLRVLLTYGYRQKYRIRSEPPQPLALESRPPQTLNLLQPFLNHIEFFVRTNELRSALLLLNQTVRCAGLECAVKTRQRLSSNLSAVGEKTTDTTAMEQVVSLMCGPLSTSFEFTLPNAAKLSVGITTDLSPPTYGTTYTLDGAVLLGDTPDLMARINFSDFEQLLRHVEKILRESVVECVAQNTAEWTVDATGSELRASNAGSSKRLSVLLSNGRLAVSVLAAGDAKAKPQIAGAWRYNGAGSHQDKLISVCQAAAAA